MVFTNKSMKTLNFEFRFVGDYQTTHRVSLSFADQLFLPKTRYEVWAGEREEVFSWMRKNTIDLQETNIPYTVETRHFNKLFQELKTPFIQKVPTYAHAAKGLFNALHWATVQELIGDGINKPIFEDGIPVHTVHGTNPWKEAVEGPSEKTQERQQEVNRCLRELREKMEEEIQSYA